MKGRGQGRVKGYREEEVTCEGRAGRRKGEGMRKDDGDFMCEVKWHSCVAYVFTAIFN